MSTQILLWPKQTCWRMINEKSTYNRREFGIKMQITWSNRKFLSPYPIHDKYQIVLLEIDAPPSVHPTIRYQHPRQWLVSWWWAHNGYSHVLVFFFPSVNRIYQRWWMIFHSYLGILVAPRKDMGSSTRSYSYLLISFSGRWAVLVVGKREVFRE